MGGTELMCTALQAKLQPELLQKFQIWPSRVRSEAVDNSLIQILYQHDLPGDPESEHLKNGGYNKFERIVFVSNWQMQRYIDYYDIPWYKCVVIENAIEVSSDEVKPTDPSKVKVIYHTTPHRGLELLVPVFERLAERHSDIHLDVYSSFSVYGWEQRDEPYKPLFDRVINHPQMTYHGGKPNSVVREALRNADIFAYPSIWQETSCIALIEAMATGLVCVHPNYGALSETASRWTWEYQWQQDKRDHMIRLSYILEQAINNIRTKRPTREFAQAAYAQSYFGWKYRASQWTLFLQEILDRKGIK